MPMAAQSDRKRRFARFVVASLVIVGLGLSYAGYHIYSLNEAMRNSYAEWWVADMVIEYLQANHDAWPRDWSELRQPYQNCVKRSGRPWAFEELQTRVDVDWQADPKQLAAAAKLPEPTFRVIWLRDGTDASWERHKPDQMIYDYFRNKNIKRRQ